MRAQDFPGWLAAIAGLSAEQRGEAVLALEHRTVGLNRGGFRRGGECDSLPDWR